VAPLPPKSAHATWFGAGNRNLVPPGYVVPRAADISAAIEARLLPDSVTPPFVDVSVQGQCELRENEKRAPGGNRTLDTPIKSRLLFDTSHGTIDH
jgi:hypothetical protein